jgi:alpha-beta hydrolase superfamily lysophospholipase
MKINTWDGKELFLNIWNDVENPKGVVHIIHGMVEYGARYEDLAKYLNGLGYVVIAPDHRGHGVTGFQYGYPGYFSENDGWMNVVKDNLKIYDDYKNVGKYFFIGHSMGSFLLRTIICSADIQADGYIFSGSGNPKASQMKIGLFLANIIKKISGDKKKSKFMNDMMFKGFNDRFAPNRSEFDWLSRDNNQVDLYEKSPWCGFVPTAAFFCDFLAGILRLYDLEKSCTDKGVSKLWLFGENDPVSGYGKDLLSIKEKYLSNSEFIIYPEMRHEILNEIGREKVFKDIGNFIMRGE